MKPWLEKRAAEMRRRMEGDGPLPRSTAARRYYEKNREEIRAKAKAKYRETYVRVERVEMFDARCLVCGRDFQHDGTRVTCSDECRRKKILRVRDQSDLIQTFLPGRVEKSLEQ